MLYHIKLTTEALVEYAWIIFDHILTTKHIYRYFF